MTMVPILTKCPTCGVVVVAEIEPRVVCITRHHDGRCCHAGQWVRADDGTLQFLASSPDCYIVDVFPTVAA